ITILGTNTIGNALTASVKISDLDGDIAGSHRYQWKRDGVNIGGETESNQYNLGLGDAGREISVEVRPQDVKGKFGVSKLSSAKTIAAPDLNFSASAETKRLKFSWNSIPQASFYKLLYNPDGVSGYSPLDSNLIATSFDMDISVHRFNWVNASLVLEACNTNTCYSTPPKGVANLMLNSIGYLKASNSGYDDRFGHTLTISSDGNTLAVGAYNEGNSFRGVLNSADTEPDDNTMVGAGAVYVFVRELNVWTQQAYIKASNTRGDDYFGSAIALSADGNTLAVGASREASANKGVINSATADPGDNDAIDSGAVYVFTRDNGAWNQQAYIKASNTATYALFGISVALSADGNTLAVGSQYEKSSANSIIHSATADPDVGLAYLSGAVYTFVRNSSQWNQQAYIKASNSGPSDQFGSSVALSSDGNTLAVGAIGEDSATKQIINSGNYPTDSLASHAGAVYVYNRVEGLWSKRAYIKASNAEKSDVFGFSVSLSGDGKILAVGAPGEGSLLSTDTENNDSSNVGAAYIYRLGASGWGQETYLKASNPNTLFGFGLPLQLSRNGNALLVGSWREASRTKGVNLGEEFEPGNYVSGSVGAGYLFKSTLNTWKQQAYIKASNSEEGDYFSVALSINSDATIIVMGASGEDSASKSTDTALDQSDNSLDASGAVYLY
ncbi:MAG: FG-GAP repeat protein, partial [Gammaproteobacteria bacterium]|nr:FG-GAP repeat protein [Gammaproteobacteria bacterium]